MPDDFIVNPATGGSPAHDGNAVIPTGPGQAVLPPKTRPFNPADFPTADSAKAAYRDFMSANMQNLQNGSYRRGITEHGEALMRHATSLAAGQRTNVEILDIRTGAIAAPQLPDLKDQDDVDRFTQETREIEQLRQEAAYDDPAELARFDQMHEPAQLTDYTAFESGPARQVLFDAGVHPATANYLASQLGTYEAWDDGTWEAKVLEARGLIEKMPSGRRTIEDARAFLERVEGNEKHPLHRVVQLACAFPIGIKELARLERRSRRAA